MTNNEIEVEAVLRLALEALKHTHPSPLTSFYTIGDRDKAIKAIEEHLAQPEQEPENRCVRELREFAKSNQGAYIFPSWDGHRVLKYLGDTTSPQRTWVGLTDEEMQFLATAIGQAQQIIDTHNAEFVTARDDLRRCAELLAAHGIKGEA